MSKHSRRAFLQLMTALAGSGLSGIVSAAGASQLHNAAPGANLLAENKSKAYTVLPWKGDDFALGHRLRDGEMPKFPDVADRKADFVIVGGGMAGLACAHFLKGNDILLLEQYAEPGGTSSGGSYNGIAYSMGAVCTGSHDGIIGELFSDLNLKPVMIPPEQTAWHCDNKWYQGIEGSDKFYTELNRLRKDIAAINKRMETASAEERYATFNNSSFDKLLSGYDAGFKGLVSNTCRSFFCGTPEEVSASAGMFMIRALTTNSYVCEGGNSGIARTLQQKVDADSPGKLQRSSFVWLVEKKGDGASVVYSDKTGEIHRVDCKHVVVATPPLVALRIIPQLPQTYKDKLQALEYSAFLVANFCMKNKVFKNPYQSFADAPFPFGQMVLAEAPYEAQGRYKSEMGSVLTVYHPFEHGTAGRAQMLGEDNPESKAESLIGDLSKLIEGFQGNLEQVVLTRWGHALILPKPGMAPLMTEIQGLDPDWLSFAHSSARGGPSLEGAISAAHYAAERCLKVKK